MSRFNFTAFDSLSEEMHENVESKFRALESEIELIVDCPEKEIALQRLEAAFMWVGKAIAKDQLERTA